MAQSDADAAVRRAQPSDDARAHPPAPSAAASRWAITRGQLLALLAFLLPAAGSMLAPMLTTDIAYQVRTGRLILDAGHVIDRDPFTFTVQGEPWLNQQWLAGVLFALGHELSGWGGLLLLRAGLVGLTFALVYAACRATAAPRMLASLVAIGAFVVAASNLALRSQTLGVLAFAAVVAILAWRREHPRLLWLIPLLMVAWANTHGSFFMGWAAIGLAALDDLLARRRLAPATIAVGIASVAATLMGPWGLATWSYVVELSGNPLIGSFVSEWQPPTLRTPTGILFFASLALVLGLLLVRGRVISWLALLWLAGLALLAMLAARNVVWWAIGAAPLVALLAAGLVVRGRRLGDAAFDEPRGIGYTAIAALAGVLTLAVLPWWRPSDPLTGPQGVLQDAPRGVTEALLSEAAPGDRLLAWQRWASWFEFAVPDVLLMVDTRLELYDAQVWADYLHVTNGRADWADILDRWDVTFVALEAADEQLRPFLDADPAWQLRHEDEEGALYGRAGDGCSAAARRA